MKGYINIDNCDEYKVDMKLDLNQKLPFKDQTVTEIICWSVLEHIENYVQLMEEMSRVLIPGGVLKFRVPIVGTVPDLMSPDHCSKFIPQTMMFFTDESLATHHKNKCSFSIKNLWVTTPWKHIKLPWKMYYINSFVNNLVTGIEGEFIKRYKT